VGHCYRPFPSVRVAERQREACQHPGPQCIIRLWEAIEGFLQQVDAWPTGESWPRPCLLEAKGGMSQGFGYPSRPCEIRRTLEGIPGLWEIAGFGLCLAQS
jgi:hypothetical protein